MKEELANLFAIASKEKMDKDSFSEFAVGIVLKHQCEMLDDLMKCQEEVVSSPIRFNGVSVERMKQVFEKHGIKYDVGF